MAETGFEPSSSDSKPSVLSSALSHSLKPRLVVPLAAILQQLPRGISGLLADACCVSGTPKHLSVSPEDCLDQGIALCWTILQLGWSCLTKVLWRDSGQVQRLATVEVALGQGSEDQCSSPDSDSDYWCDHGQITQQLLGISVSLSVKWG